MYQKNIQQYTLPLIPNGTTDIFCLDDYLPEELPSSYIEKIYPIESNEVDEWLNNHQSQIEKIWFHNQIPQANVSIYLITHDENRLYTNDQPIKHIATMLQDALLEAKIERYKTDGLQYYLDNLHNFEQYIVGD